jgi:WD40 repeat protein
MDVSAIAEWTGPLVVDLEWVPGTLELAVASPDSIQLYELASRTPYRSLYPQAAEIVDLAFSPDRNWLVSGSRRVVSDGSYTSNLEIWSGPDLKPQGILNTVSSGLVRLAFTPDSRTLIDAYTEPEPDQFGSLEIRQVPGWATTSRLTTGTVLELAVSTDGVRLATSPDLYNLLIWDLKTGKQLIKIPTSFIGAVSSLVFSPDHSTLASGHYDGTIRLWDLNSGSLKLEITSNGIINTMAFSPDGSILATGSGGTEAVLRLWSVNSGELLRDLPGHPSAITNLLFASDSQLLVSGSYDGLVRIWGIWH